MYKVFTMDISGLSVNSYPGNYNWEEQDHPVVNLDVKNKSHGKSEYQRAKKESRAEI